MALRISVLLLLLATWHQASANDSEEETLFSELMSPSSSTSTSTTTTTTTTTTAPPPEVSAAATLGTLFRQARSEKYYANHRFGDEALDTTASGATASARVDPYERDPAYFEARCLTCDPNKVAALATTDRE